MPIARRVVVDSAQSLQSVIAGEFQVGTQLVGGLLDLQVVHLQRGPQGFQIRAQAHGLLDRDIGVDGRLVLRRFDRFRQVDRQIADVRIQVGGDLLAQRVLYLLQRETRLGYGDLGGGLRLLRIINIERRHGAQVELLLSSLERFLRQLQRFFLHPQIGVGQDHVPVGILGILDVLQNLVAQLKPGLAQIAAGDDDGQPVDVRAAIANAAAGKSSPKQPRSPTD